MRTPCHTGPQGGCTLEMSESAEAVGPRLCHKKRVGWTLIPVGIYDWLVWIILCAGRELRPFIQRQAGTVLDPQDKEGCLAIAPYQWEHNVSWACG